MRLPRTPALSLDRTTYACLLKKHMTYKERARVMTELGFANRWLLHRRSGRYRFNSRLARYAHRRIWAFVATRPAHLAWDFSKLPRRRYVPMFAYEARR